MLEWLATCTHRVPIFLFPRTERNENAEMFLPPRCLDDDYIFIPINRRYIISDVARISSQGGGIPGEAYGSNVCIFIAIIGY